MVKMNTLQLENIFEKLKINKKFYYGIFPIDRLPIVNKFPTCLIINNQSSYQEGEHWIAIYFDKHKNASFFDSFAKSPSYYGLKSYLKKFSNNVQINKKRIQSNFSNYCGLYCVFFLIYKLKGRSMFYFQNLFKNNPNKNDKMFNKWINRYY